VNGSTTKLGASYFFVFNPERSEGALQHRCLEVDYPPRGGFFIETDYGVGKDLVSDVGLHYA
jgi:hypothetical protein